MSLLVAVPALGCNRLREELSDRRPPPSWEPPGKASAATREAPSAFPARDSADAGAPRKVKLEPETRRKMKLAPRREPPGTIAFGKGRLGVLSDGALAVRDLRKLESGFTVPLLRPRALTTLADGSLLAVGAAMTLRLLPQDRKPQVLSRLFLLPGSTLFGDRVRPDRVWILPAAGKTLYGYDAVHGANLVAPAEWFELPSFDARAFGSLRDGSFVYSTASGVLQFYGKGEKKPLAGDVATVVRLVPASRPDTGWVVLPKSARLVRLLAGKLYTLLTVDFAETASDVDAAGDRLAVLELAQPDDAPWSFVLEVFDVTGKKLGKTTLPAEESLDPAWEKTLLQNRAVAACADPPLVAVGGPTHVDVFDGKLEKTLYAGPAAAQ